MENILKQNIIENIGLDLLSQDQQEEALLNIGEIIFQAVLVKSMEFLNDQDKDEFEKLFDSDQNNEDVVINFLREKIPEFDRIISEEVEKFKTESADFIEDVKKQA